MDRKAFDFLDSIDTRVSRIKPSEFAEQKRYMTTAETRWPGYYSFDLTPYLREVVDCLMPDVPVTKIAVIKGAQIGFSTGVIENGIPWIISEYPANVLFMAADDDAVKLAVQQKLDPAINSCGVAHLIGAQKASVRKNQRTGDTLKGKEFPGGRLYLFSVKNAGKMRQFSAKFGFLDDLDSAKEADAKEGSLIKLVDGRFTTFGDTAKIFYISTPIIKELSVIEPLFENGDQRYYHVPCPLCGEYIILSWSIDVDKSIVSTGKAGVYYEVDPDNKSIVIASSVGYVCQKCGGFFKEDKKYEMNQLGNWKPTAKPKTPNMRSYHISSLYAPPGAISWAALAQEWVECWPDPISGKPNVAKLQAFKNLRLGQTYASKSRHVNVMQLQENTRHEYRIGTVPVKLSEEDGNGPIVMITIGVDLNGTIDDARLDYIVTAWSFEGSSYAIDHGSIGSYQGRASKADDKREILSYRNEARNSAWNIFFKDVVCRQWVCDDSNKTMGAMICTIDTGYHTVYAYEFLKTTSNCMLVGVKGQEDNKFSSFDSNTPMFRASANRDDLFILEVNRYKDELEERTKLKWVDRENQMQPHGFMNFPMSENGKFDIHYFKQYAGEVRKTKLNDDATAIASRWVKRYNTAANHFWDCEVYTKAARDIFISLWGQVEGLKRVTWHTFASCVLNK